MLICFFLYFLTDQGIEISSLTLLTDDMIKEIIPLVGHRAKFKANLEEWRKVIALANDQVSYLVKT